MTAMIDTTLLETVIQKTVDDKNLIHHTVKKAGKEPTKVDLLVLHVETRVDMVALLLTMEWDVTHNISDPSFDFSTSGDYRHKWFAYAIRRMNKHAKGTGITFGEAPFSFEFGVKRANDSLRVILWGTARVIATSDTQTQEWLSQMPQLIEERAP